MCIFTLHIHAAFHWASAFALVAHRIGTLGIIITCVVSTHIGLILALSTSVAALVLARGGVGVSLVWIIHSAIPAVHISIPIAHRNILLSIIIIITAHFFWTFLSFFHLFRNLAIINSFCHVLNHVNDFAKFVSVYTS